MLVLIDVWWIIWYVCCLDNIWFVCSDWKRMFLFERFLFFIYWSSFFDNVFGNLILINEWKCVLYIFDNVYFLISLLIWEIVIVNNFDIFNLLCIVNLKNK